MIAVYSTPWGVREMTEAEVTDLAVQGVTCTPVDAPAETSLAQEKDDMAGVVFADAPMPKAAKPKI